ncbi:Spy/CpxP family protein refolding chaperone [Methylophaga sp.]|uniref:Spy/CpxP family protein refolding chaperone n=1 Tax=Methylophaga sp. TaxID=2024840 RepID=UPI003F6A5236
MRKLFILLSMIPLAAVAMPSEDSPKQCADAHQHMKHKKGGDVPFYLRDMDLTDTQKAQIKALMAKRHSDKQSGKAEYWENKKAIKTLTQAETLDEVALEQAVDKSMAMKKAHAMDSARFHHHVFNVLTSEQQKTLEQKMAEYKQKMRH